MLRIISAPVFPSEAAGWFVELIYVTTSVVCWERNCRNSDGDTQSLNERKCSGKQQHTDYLLQVMLKVFWPNRRLNSWLWTFHTYKRHMLKSWFSKRNITYTRGSLFQKALSILKRFSRRLPESPLLRYQHVNRHTLQETRKKTKSSETFLVRESVNELLIRSSSSLLGSYEKTYSKSNKQALNVKHEQIQNVIFQTKSKESYKHAALPAETCRSLCVICQYISSIPLKSFWLIIDVIRCVSAQHWISISSQPQCWSFPTN